MLCVLCVLLRVLMLPFIECRSGFVAKCFSECAALACVASERCDAEVRKSEVRESDAREGGGCICVSPPSTLLLLIPVSVRENGVLSLIDGRRPIFLRSNSSSLCA